MLDFRRFINLNTACDFAITERVINDIITIPI